MFILQFFIALIVGLLVAWFVAGSYRRRGIERAGGWPIFSTVALVALFAAWAGGIWLIPFGPRMGGVSWLPFVVVGFFVALLLLALMPPRRADTVAPPPDELRAPQRASTGAVEVGVLFWLLLIVLLVGIVGRYAWMPAWPPA